MRLDDGDGDIFDDVIVDGNVVILDAKSSFRDINVAIFYVKSASSKSSMTFFVQNRLPGHDR